jgi:S-adenosylmethionine:tRNA ribosyltransferase-isomerase
VLIPVRTSDFDYSLPAELVAQTPIEPRDSSRLLVLDRGAEEMAHRRFSDILDCLRPGDLMVFNQSRVIPARLFGRRKDTGGKVELLLLRREEDGVWMALGKPGRRLRPGNVIILDRPASGVGVPSDASWTGNNPRDSAKESPEELEIEVLASGEDGIKTVRLSDEAGLHRWGEVPLPPYIHRRLEDPERYQTVYSCHSGSVAAPTAGLHFTQTLLDRLQQAGVELAFVTLHVGLDTFRPVHGEDPREHQIHTEHYEVSAETADALQWARGQGRRIIAVGTTSVRVLEQLGQDQAHRRTTELVATQGQADLFILPGHRFRMVDAMLTNFHLPRSTLLMLVSAFAGRELILRTYQEAIDQRYRFYSFGDAMLIL